MYKRQNQYRTALPGLAAEKLKKEKPSIKKRASKAADTAAVSYTHLTLPTSDLVEISVVAVSLKKKREKIIPSACSIRKRT